jgi:hypothetical protein
VRRVGKICDLLGRALGEVKTETKRGPSKSPSKRISDESSEAECINEVLSNLRRGYLMVKHTVGGEDRKDKFVYLSGDDRFLCWKSVDR